jgi:hypothetical protein
MAAKKYLHILFLHWTLILTMHEEIYYFPLENYFPEFNAKSP